MALPGSRGFLLVLLLVTVTCIVVVQVSMDGWIRNGALRFYELGVAEKKNGEQNPIRIPSFVETTAKVPIPTSRPLETTQMTTKYENQSSNSAKTFGFDKTTVIDKSAPSKMTEDKLQRTSRDFSQSIQVRTKVSGSKDVPERSELKRPVSFGQQSRLKAIAKSKALPLRTKKSAMAVLKKLPAINNADVTNVLLLAYFRSGSSFTGELLQQNWKTFYQFEPLHYMTYDSRIPENRTEEAFSLFKGIYTCNFTGQDRYFEWVTHLRNQFLFSRSMFLWFYCRVEPRLCFSPDFVSTVCQRAPVRLSKVTRVSMRQLSSFMAKNDDLNLKVVYLTRDPRGILSSRWSLDWCNGTDCSDPNFLCEEMSDDIAVFEDMKRKYPSKFIRVRYEDISLNTTEVARSLFKFLNIPFPRSLNRFLKSHTTARKSDDRDRYSTRRNSSTVAFSWRQRLTYAQVKSVQDSCYDVLDKLSYPIISSPEELVQDSKTLTASNSQLSIGRNPEIPNRSIVINSEHNSISSSFNKQVISLSTEKDAKNIISL